MEIGNIYFRNVRKKHHVDCLSSDSDSKHTSLYFPYKNIQNENIHQNSIYCQSLMFLYYSLSTGVILFSNVHLATNISILHFDLMVDVKKHIDRRAFQIHGGNTAEILVNTLDVMIFTCCQLSQVFGNVFEVAIGRKIRKIL